MYGAVNNKACRAVQFLRPVRVLRYVVAVACFFSLAHGLGAETGRTFQVALAGGFNRIFSGDDFVKQNTGAEFSVLSTLPWQIWREDFSLVVIRAQFTRFTDEIVLPTNASTGTSPTLFYPTHSQMKADLRQVFHIWQIGWSLGLGFQVPVYNSVLTPLGRFTFADAKENYPGASTTLDKIRPAYAIFMHAGIDQKFLDDALIAGIGLDISVASFTANSERVAFNVYAGARLW